MSEQYRQNITITFDTKDDKEMSLLSKIKSNENYHAKTKLLWAKELNIEYKPKSRGRPKNEENIISNMLKIELRIEKEKNRLNNLKLSLDSKKTSKGKETINSKIKLKEELILKLESTLKNESL